MQPLRRTERRLDVAWRGRKRKQGARHPGGQLKREKQPDDRVRTSRQPHRRILRTEDRMSEHAESPLGRLYLRGQLRADETEDPEIAELRYQAGQHYAVAVGKYRSVIEAPKGTAGAGRGFDCCHGLIAEDDACECRRRRRRYETAFEALAQAGRRAQMTVNRIAVQQDELTEQDRVYLIAGLDALVRGLGLTRRRPNAHHENTH